jgi:CheY-like chemotaxis protein
MSIAGGRGIVSNINQNSARTGTILIVDDEPSTVDLLSHVLLAAGHRVVTAVSGQEAVSKAVEEKPDMVFMDIIMPGMDGYEATVRIKRQPSLQDTPVVYLTGRAMEEDCGRSFATGGSILLR